MKVYHDLLRDVLENGNQKSDRTGTGTRSVFGRQIRIDLNYGFPLLTTKKMHWKSVLHELLWIISGDTNVKYLNDNGVKIWDQWAKENGELGPVYGEMWRRWPTSHGTIDQLGAIISRIKSNPDCRRLIVSAWNPNVVDGLGHGPEFAALPPCHMMFQFYVADGKLSCQMYQRSADIFLGVPFNIASYSLLTHMVAYVCGLGIGEFIHTFGDLHLYNNHVEQAKTQLSREPYELPRIRIVGAPKDIDNFSFESIELIDYKCHPTIKAEVSI